MTEKRQQRLKRLVDLRAKELDHRVKELTLARTRESKSERDLLAAKAEKQRELEARNVRAQDGLPAGDWGQAETWLTVLAQKELAAQRQRELAAREVVGARGRVAEAMLEREKIDLLMGRLAAQMRQEETRLERKNEDEHASVHGSAQRASSSKRNP